MERSKITTPSNSTEHQMLIQAQEKLCDEREVPMFAPSNGKCSSCHQDCVNERWATEHITGCGKCNRTFCD